MTELFVATKKGLFVLEGEPGAEFDRPRWPSRRRAGPRQDVAPGQQGTRAGLCPRGGSGGIDHTRRPSPRAGAAATGFRPTAADAPVELYFGATSGDVFGSGDAGASWFDVATRLPPVYAVAAVR
ncbi:MAG: hypothetical protein M3401_03640 [Actinomycetota bacterium]|nr:hypothetical protein [Actinomycetota bacterium]